MSLISLPKEMYAEIARFLGDEFPGNGFRRAAGTVQIKDVIQGDTYLNDILHSFDDQPSITDLNGKRMWYQHGKLHRDDDKPAIIYPNGVCIWYINGIYQRFYWQIITDCITI